MHFYGIFGTFFMFDDIFNYELLTKIFELGEDYELILYRHYQFYLNYNNTKRIKAIKSFVELENNKLESKLICLISPKVIF